MKTLLQKWCHLIVLLGNITCTHYSLSDNLSSCVGRTNTGFSRTPPFSTIPNKGSFFNYFYQILSILYWPPTPCWHLWQNFFTVIRENLHIVHIFSTSYLPRFVNVVIERSPKLSTTHWWWYFCQIFCLHYYQAKLFMALKRFHCTLLCTSFKIFFRQGSLHYLLDLKCFCCA